MAYDVLEVDPILPTKQINKKFEKPVHKADKILVYLNLFLR